MELVDGLERLLDAIAEDPSDHSPGRIHSLKGLPNGKMRVKIKGEGGRTYILEASSNLADWKAICVVHADQEGNCDYEDVVSANHQSRFYRLVEVD